MVAETFRDALDIFAHIRTRITQHTKEQTLREMPEHLIDDVNGRGLPPDRLLVAANRNRSPTLKLIEKI
jgi:hypothetical protein